MESADVFSMWNVTAIVVCFFIIIIVLHVSKSFKLFIICYIYILYIGVILIVINTSVINT